MPLSKEQLAVRKNRIGSSMIAAIAGVHPYKTPLDAFWDYVGPSSDRFQGNTNTEFGDEFEPQIGAMYARRMGVSVSKVTHTHVHPKLTFMAATPDFLAHSHDTALYLAETKNVGWRGMSHYGEQGTQEYPDWHRCQMAWQLAVLDLSRCDLAAYFGGSDLRIYTFQRDLEIENLLINLAQKFFTDHIQVNNPPPETSPADLQNYLKKKYRENNGKMLRATPEVMPLLLEYAAAKADEKKAALRVETLEGKIKTIIGEHDGILAQDGKITWKKVDKKGFTVEASSSRQIRCSGKIFKAVEEKKAP